ncbi:MAG: alpha/beta hydrolase [Gammaproteobacteria bacterium]|nr:alpha/beta hydrolase [Gammaproteobacteria bacterium]
MRHSDGTFDSGDAGQVYWQSWTPAESPRAVLLLVHGLAEHSGRYEGFAEFFTSAGFAVHALDHPGHGRSAGHRCHIGRFADFTSTLDRYLALVKTTHPGTPIFLVGHSMGGLIAAAYLIEQQSQFAAAVLSGPAIRAPQQPSRFALFIMRIISRLLPRLGVMQLDSSGVSKDPDVVSKYDNDPLVFRGKVTARLAAELFSEMDKVMAHAATIRLPLLILHGGSDSLTDVAGSKALHEAVSSTDKEIIVYDGLYHEIFNEPERIAVMTDMKDWLEARLANS